MSTIANSTIKLSLDSTSVQRGVDAINKKFAGMGTAMKVGMAAAATASLAYFKGFVDRMGEVADMATRLGITTDEVQRIGLVAKQSGTDVDAVAKAMEKFSVNLVKAGEGGEAAAKGLARLGITAEEFNSLSMDQKLLKLSEAYAASNKGAQELAGLQALLGKSGAELIPLLSMGPDNMAKALGRAKPVIGQTVQEMEQLGDRMDELNQKADYFFAKAATKSGSALEAYITMWKANAEAGLELGRGVGSAATGDFAGAKRSAETAESMVYRGVKDANYILKPQQESEKDRLVDERRSLEALYEKMKRDPGAGAQSGDLFMAIKKLTAAIEGGDTPKFPR